MIERRRSVTMSIERMMYPIARAHMK